MPRVPSVLLKRPLRRAVAALACWLAAGSAFGAVVVRDDAGLELRLAQPAQRIVSLAPHVTELLFEVGAGDRVVGATAYSDYPEAAKRIPRVGALSGIDIESIVALKPDLVIAWLSGTSKTQIEALERLGIPVFRSEPHTLGDVTATIARFGALTGRVEPANAVIARFTAKADALRETYAHRSPVRVFYQVWNKPLMTIGGPQLITQVIELCAGRNVFASLTTLAPIVDVEAVIAADPQLIVTSSTSADRRADLAQWGQWTGVSAVVHQRYLFIDPVLISRHTSRLLIGAETLCRAIDDARKPG
jgi:iron complex transport system substrate-binding protein